MNYKECVVCEATYVGSSCPNCGSRETFELPCDECGCFDCEDNCSTCWGGPMCAFNDESPCIKKRREKEHTDG